MDEETPKPKVLVVDDEPSVLKMVKLILTKMGCHVSEAASCGQAVKIFKDGGPYVLALLDETLPDGRGKDLALQLKTTQPDLKVLVLSGYNLGAAAGGFPFLGKPFAPKALQAKVREVLDQ